MYQLYDVLRFLLTYNLIYHDYLISVLNEDNTHLNQRLVLFKGFLLKRPLTIPLLKRPQMGSFKKASDELF